MKILVACEYSQIVTKAFRDKGHDAFSCDILPTEGNPHWHIQDDVLNHLWGWDMIIAHPECTHLTLAGARWFYDSRFPNKHRDRELAIEFFKKIQDAPCDKIAIENPQPLKYVMDRVGKYNQKIQPWQFGDNETKGICLWLKGLDPLKLEINERPENVESRVWRMPPGPNRKKERSRFFAGVARAMADQWG